jgi:hypothetical protein
MQKTGSELHHVTTRAVSGALQSAEEFEEPDELEDDAGLSRESVR